MDLLSSDPPTTHFCLGFLVPQDTDAIHLPHFDWNNVGGFFLANEYALQRSNPVYKRECTLLSSPKGTKGETGGFPGEVGKGQ